MPHKLIRLSPDEIKVVELDQTGFNSQYTLDPDRDVPLNKPVTFKSVKGLKLMFTEIGEGVFAAPYITDASQYSEEELKKNFGYTSSNNCCMTCQGHTICASSITTSCGSCGWDQDFQ